MKIPETGGSFIRKPDGTLQRVAFTDHRRMEPPAAPAPAAKPVAAPEAPAGGETPKTNAKG